MILQPILLDEIGRIRSLISSSFSRLKFSEKSHTYKVDGIVQISSTTYIKRFAEEFKSKEAARNLAFKINRKVVHSKKRTDKYYLRRWQQQNLAATLSGSRVHEYVEYNYPEFLDHPACIQEIGVRQFFLDLDPKYKVVMLECRMHHFLHPRAGTTDCILYNTETGKFLIVDWKTNDTNILQYYGENCLLGPFSDLVDNDYNKYSLQLSDYQNMLQQLKGFVVEDRWIVHLSSKDPEQLDISKQGKNGYNIQKVDPLMSGTYYRVYSTKDHSVILNQCYDKDFANVIN